MHNSMARRTSNKIQPAVQTFTFATPPPPVGYTGRFVIDLSQTASLLNRRFYRQGLNWAVAGFKVLSTSSGAVTCSKIPNTWVTSNAWEKAFRAWNKQQMDMIEESGAESAVARFRDFKVFLDTDHVDAGYAANLLPIDALGNTPLLGEWEPSEIVVPNSGGPGVNLEYKLHMVGINQYLVNPSRGILEGYADSRAYPQSPDPVSPAIDSTQNWMSQMFDVGDNMSLVVDNATDKNDDLPYDQVNYPGGEGNLPGLQLHDLVTIFNSSTGADSISVQRLKGGNFPCGLIAIDWSPTGDPQGNLVIQVDLVPGHHRGYLAEPMTEM